MLVYGNISLLWLTPGYAAEATAPLPPILNFHPLCEPTVIKEQSQIRYLNNYQEGEQERAASTKADVLLSLQQKSRSQRC
jgi:hypothetical protein